MATSLAPPAYDGGNPQAEMLRAAPNLDATAVATRVAAAPALVRKPIRTPADYGVPLPEWLQRCIEHVPPGEGMSDIFR